jgi:hypothetical protein
MSNRSTAPSAATTSEAVVSTNSHVKRRIPNYETTVFNISDNNAATVSFNATNDDFTDIPVLLNPIEGGNKITVTKKRHGAFLFASVIIATFIWSIYSIFFSSFDQFSQFGNRTAQRIISTLTSTNDTKQINKIVDRIIRDNDWKNSLIISLLHHWNALDSNSQQQLVKQPWFQHFSYLARQKLKEYRKPKSEIVAIDSKEPLFNLGTMLGILDDHGQLLKISSTSPKYQTLVSEIKQEIAQLETEAKKDTQASSSETELNLILKQQLTIDRQPSKRVLTNKKGVQSLFEQYKNAYEKGDLEKMLTLFGSRSLSKGSHSALMSNFENVFKNTSKRSINFYDFTWQVSKNNITINSNYNAMLEFNNKKGTQHIVAQAVVKAVQKEDQLYITSFKLLDSKVNVVSPQRDISENNHFKPETTAIKTPTASELQDLTTRLITAYESGDIDKFASLFSEDAKTNDRSDLVGIKKDYSELFSTTTDRQMFIQDLEWSKESASAKGTGNLEVTILSDNGNTVYSMNGKIQIVAQKTDNKIHITHLYHIEHEK